MISEVFLPIGSIVELEESDAKIMITGYLIGNDKYIYDYCGYVYPKGRISKMDTLYFDKIDIVKVIKWGYTDEEVKAVTKKVEEHSKKTNKRRKQ